MLWLRLVFVALCSSALWATPMVANAQAVPSIPTGVTYGVRSALITPGSITEVGSAASRSWAANITTGAVTVTEHTAVRVAANDVAMNAARTIPWSGVVKGAARALPYVGTGLLIWSIFDLAKCSPLTGRTDAIGCAEGIPQTETSCNYYTMGWVAAPNNKTCSAQTWCDGRAATIGSGGVPPGVLSGTGSSLACRVNNAGGFLVNQETIGVGTPGTVLSCGTGYQIGRDSKCFKTDKSDRTTIVNPDDAAPYVPFVPNPLGNAADAVKQAVGTGKVDFAPYAVPGPVTGVPFAVGNPTTVTTTNPDGTPGPSSSSQPRYDFTYPPTYGDPVTWTEKTQATNPDGSTTTTTNPEPTPSCGLPGEPLCNVKVDETGTKTASDMAAAEAALAAAQTSITNKITATGGADKRTSLPFNFSFLIPVGSCTPFEFTTGRLGGFTIDPCTNPNVQLWRDLLAWFLAGLTGWYIWGSAVSLRNGSS